MLWAIFFIIVGLFEEFLFRGYTQYTLGDSIGFWPAAVVLSCSFGAVHLGNPGEGPVGAAGVVAIGFVFAFALRRTGNLWLVVGWHASFDFGETFLYSVPNSGIVFQGHLSNASLHGAKWLTGGTVGPEGSVFSFLTMGILALAIHFLFPGKEDIGRGKVPGLRTPPGNLYEYQRKRIRKFAFRKQLISKGMVFDDQEQLIRRAGAIERKSGSKLPHSRT